MAPNRGRNRAGDSDQFLNSAPTELDPEAEKIPDASSDGDAGSDESADGTRDHYVEVGKSKLRQPKDAALGAQYRGSRVSRGSVSDEEEEHDPFNAGYEDEESVDEDEDERLEVDGGDGSGESDRAAEETSDTDLSDAPAPQASSMAANTAGREAVKTILSEQGDVASRLARSNQLDAEKGRAVKKQRAAFDSLLGARIKLQKTIIAANTIIGTSREEIVSQREDADEAIEGAEAAAFNLWSTLSGLRDDLTAVRTGEKRKRTQLSSNASIEVLWSHTQKQEEASLPHRNAILQRWSRKTHNDQAHFRSGLLRKEERQATILDVIQEQLSNPDRLLKRAHTPRSCAPLQVANKVAEDEKIYDDADFYGLLLKELLEQKSQASVETANVDLNFDLQRQVKARKNVDTKASKGRKLRHTVHEKLQNFMAPEDRRRWGERQADELFGSLFGQRLGLGEAAEEDEESVVGDQLDQALTLFRS